VNRFVSILPVDSGSNTRRASFAPNPAFFDPETIVKLAIEGLQRVASTPRRARRRRAPLRAPDPIVLKLNHNELMTYPNKFDQ